MFLRVAPSIETPLSAKVLPKVLERIYNLLSRTTKKQLSVVSKDRLWDLAYFGPEKISRNIKLLSTGGSGYVHKCIKVFPVIPTAFAFLAVLWKLFQSLVTKPNPNAI